MLSCNWHVTLRLTVFEIFGVYFLEVQNFRFWGSPGDTAPKRGEDLSGTDMFHYANFHANWREISDPGQKNTYFPYRGLPWGRDYRLMLYIFRKLEVALSCNWYVTLRFTVFEIFAINWPKFRPKNWDVGVPRGTAPKRGDCVWDRSDTYHHAKFYADRCHAVHRLRDI